MHIDTKFPLNKLNELARMESYNKHYYRPPNYLHKWWARRLGSVFRTIILGTFLEGDQDVWEAYYRRVDFGDKIVLDPFMGGGTTVVEALRLGCKIVGRICNTSFDAPEPHRQKPASPDRDAGFSFSHSRLAD